jgi:hypothetical protein
MDKMAAVADERREFEEWADRHFTEIPYGENATAKINPLSPSSSYLYPVVQFTWTAWEASWQARGRLLEEENEDLREQRDNYWKELEPLREENRELREIVNEAEQIIDLRGKFTGGDLTHIKLWRKRAAGKGRKVGAP